MNPVVHSELPYKDANRTSAFYVNCFKWKITVLRDQFNDYILAHTAMHDVKPGFPADSIDGGFYKYKQDWPSQHPLIVIGVENIEESITLIESNGGRVLGDPILISNFG